MEIKTYEEQEHVVLATSKDFELIQTQVSYEKSLLANQTYYENSGLVLFYKGKLIAESGCGCCEFDLKKEEAMKMIQDMASKGM